MPSCMDLVFETNIQVPHQWIALLYDNRSHEVLGGNLGAIFLCFHKNVGTLQKCSETLF